MAFKLNPSHIKTLFDRFTQGDLAYFMGAIDPNVHWTIADPVYDPKTKAGTYVFLSHSRLYTAHTHKEVESPRMDGESRGTDVV